MKRSHHLPIWSGCLVLLVGGLLSWRVEVWQQARQEQEAQLRFQELAVRVREQVSRSMQRYRYGLRGLRGALLTMGEDGISRARVLRYSLSRNHDQEFPGSRGMGFIRRVSPSNEAAFVQKAQADGKPDFNIRQLEPHDGDRFVIQYIEPEARNREAVGLDIASETHRRQAAERAIASGDTALTHPITLVQASGKVQRGFLMMEPVYRSGQVPEFQADREAEAFGLAYTPLVADEVLAEFQASRNDFGLALYDRSDPEQPTLFYDADAEAVQPVANTPHRTAQAPLTLYGREWVVEVRPRAAFVAGLNHSPPGQTGMLLGLTTLVLAGLTTIGLQVQGRKRETAREQARLAAIVEGANDVIIGLTPDGTVTDWNPAAAAIFGYSAAQAMGRKAVDLIVPAGLADEEARYLGQALRGETVHQVQTRRRRADGSTLEVDLTLSPIRDPQGRISGFAKTLRDITARLQQEGKILELNRALEIKVAERTDHLETSNKELADFAYLASHDLRTPLRAIDGFGKLLQKGDELTSATAQDYLGRIRLAAQQMGQVIDDMIALTQIARIEMRPETLNLSVIAQAEMDALQARDTEQRRLTLTIAPQLWVQADRTQLQMLMAQLLDNAWKFTRARPCAQIEIGRGPDDGSGRVACFVRDNGIGFDDHHAERLFAPFQRLHSAAAYPGRGLGLAIAQRIVRKHGGALLAQGRVDEGATFYFSLPRPRRS